MDKALSRLGEGPLDGPSPRGGSAEVDSVSPLKRAFAFLADAGLMLLAAHSIWFSYAAADWFAAAFGSSCGTWHSALMGAVEFSVPTEMILSGVLFVISDGLRPRSRLPRLLCVISLAVNAYTFVLFHGLIDLLARYVNVYGG